MKSMGCNVLNVLLEKELGMEWGVRWAVGARRKGSEEQEQRQQQEQEQWRQDEQEQREQQEQKEWRQENRKSNGGRQSKGKTQDRSKVKQVHFGEEEQLEETRAENADEPEVTGRLAEVRTGRGSASLVRPAGKAKERATEGKANTKARRIWPLRK